MKVQHVNTYTLPVHAAEETEIFSFSDTHGMGAVFDAAIEFIGSRARVAKNRELVFLGDIIDRGPDSGRLIARGALNPAQGDIYAGANADTVVELIGNHEQFALMSSGIFSENDEYLKDLSPRELNSIQLAAQSTWDANGGEQYFQDIVFYADIHRTRSKRLEILANWSKTLKSHCISGNLLFVHAGINPLASLEENFSNPESPFLFDPSLLNRHWAWIRESFLHHDDVVKKCGHFVMHGHTPIHRDTKNLDECIRRGRMNHDTGAWNSNKQRVSRVVGNQLDVYDVHP